MWDRTLTEILKLMHTVQIIEYLSSISNSEENLRILYISISVEKYIPKGSRNHKI